MNIPTDFLHFDRLNLTVLPDNFTCHGIDKIRFFYSGFIRITQSTYTHPVSINIKGIESMHMIRKGQAGTKNVLEEIELINRLFNVA